MSTTNFFNKIDKWKTDSETKEVQFGFLFITTEVLVY